MQVPLHNHKRRGELRLKKKGKEMKPSEYFKPNTNNRTLLAKAYSYELREFLNQKSKLRNNITVVKDGDPLHYCGDVVHYIDEDGKSIKEFRKEVEAISLFEISVHATKWMKGKSDSRDLEKNLHNYRTAKAMLDYENLLYDKMKKYPGELILLMKIDITALAADAPPEHGVSVFEHIGLLKGVNLKKRPFKTK